MELDPEIRGFVEESDRMFGVGYDGLAMPEQRQVYNEWCRRFSPPLPTEVVASEVTLPRNDREGGAVRARLQKPDTEADRAGRLPILIYYHGGGWIMGSPETHEAVTAELAHQVGAAVLSVDYRLAPEHPFPAAFDDAYAAMLWAGQSGAGFGLDPTRLAVAGDSAGGNLAAAVALAARDRGGPKIALQALMYPVLKAARAGPGIDPAGEAGIAGYVRAYAGVGGTAQTIGRDFAGNPYAMPLAAADFTGLAPAFIAAAGLDVLREDAEQYAAALRQAGVPVDYRCAEGLIHSYLRCIHFSRAAYLEFQALCQALRQAFGVAERSTSGARLPKESAA